MLKTKIRKANELSKRLDQKVRIKNNNQNKIKLINEEQIYSLVKLVVEEPEVDILEKIEKTKEKEKNSQNSREDKESKY